MLSRLSIRDIVLIERLDIDFSAGLSVLTGETGAGKSILLDALSLALGARGDASLVRHGADAGPGDRGLRCAAQSSGARDPHRQCASTTMATSSCAGSRVPTAARASSSTTSLPA